MYPPPQLIQSEVWARLPDPFRKAQDSEWGRINFPGHRLDCFLEGPSFDRRGNLYLVDIPFGRIFCIDTQRRWTLVTEYDGWPNGLKIHADGRIFITDYLNGIMLLDPADGTVTPYLRTWRSEGFKGVNDLFFAPDGDLYFTDQGQTGLHDPTGRVFRIRESAGQPDSVECLLDCGPSPNGLVLNASGTQLYVAMTRDNAVWRLPLQKHGGVSKVGRFIQLSGGIGPDGLALDEEGGLTVAHPGTGVWRFDSAGRPTHYVAPPETSRPHLLCTNVAYGDNDQRAIYITDSVQGTVLRARTGIAGRLMYSHRS